MQIGLTEILAYAEKKGFAIGAFNTPNLECITAVLSAAEKLKVPVILSHAQLHEKLAPLSVIGPIMVDAAKRAAVPVCVHLDHCEDLAYLQRALALGFSGVMYDGSQLSYEENTENTIKAVQLASVKGAGVEAELGTLASGEGGAAVGEPVYTDPDLAAKFSGETGIDALAPSFGTAHGIYKERPRLDFTRLKIIMQKTGLPLVMHGGSGVSGGDYKLAIQNGIRKINYYSYMSKAGANAVQHLLETENMIFFHDLAAVASAAMEENAGMAMNLFMSVS